jgi:hypothetical protein
MSERSVQLNLPPVQVHTLDRPRSTAVHSLDCDRWATLPGIGLAKAGIQRKAAAADMELDPSLLTAQLTGKKHLSWLRMGLLPREFWIELVTLICEFHEISFGQTPQERVDIEIGRAFRESVMKVAQR